mmetsp:Transcript_42679/g.96839  ORF Transcript_42679/g.96839 Transcript_42679/m.96839 type:complete len:287 (-) Transcript_42679:738-1598(-)
MSPCWYSPRGFAKRLWGPRASQEAPMSKNTPKVMTLVTRASGMASPTLKSAGVGRLETESRFFTGSASVILRPSILSPALKSPKGLGNWLAGHRASREAPMSTKTPKGMVRVTVPVTSMPALKSSRAACEPPASAAAANVSGRATSRSSACGSTLMITRSVNSSPTLYSEAAFGSPASRRSASLVEPMSMKSPSPSLEPDTLPVTVAPRTSLLSGVPTSSSDFVVTVMRSPSTLMTMRSATCPLVYWSEGWLNKRLGASTSVESPASKNTPKDPTVATMPSKRSPS